MNYQWILLAFFVVAMLLGLVKALKRSMLKNVLRLASVAVAFLIVFFLQKNGILQSGAAFLAERFDLASFLPEIEGLEGLTVALLSTLGSAILFAILFLPVLWVLRIVIHCVVGIVEKAKAKKAARAAADLEAENVGSVAVTTGGKEPKADAEGDGKNGKKKKKPVFYKQKGWKRAVSALVGMVSGALLLGVLMTPVFYLMSLASTVTHATDGLDADDSAVYKTVEVVDTYLVAPYEESFVGHFYDEARVSDLMTYTAKLGGKVTLENGEIAYADDILKNILAHGVSAAAQITSAKSECQTVKEDVEAIVTDPTLSSIAADLLMAYLQNMEMEEPAEDDLLGGLIHNFVVHYKEADKVILQQDMKALGNVVGVLAEEGVFAELMNKEGSLESLLGNEEALGDVVAAISGLSAFGPTIEGAFEVGVDVLGETLLIPENDAAAYDHFMEDLLDQMKKSDGTSFDLNTVRYYIVTCVKNGVKVSATNGV
ncbi:MAG: hypothetical protein J6W28_04075 [Clostridia bacterium]|nr:hypothetical protein [Clostridia bacterium]